MAASDLDLRRLTFVPERDGVLVGCPDIQSYALFPADGAELLRRLQGGIPPADAAGWYETTFGERIDIEDFLATLQELGFVREESGRSSDPEPARVRWQRLGRAAFSPVALAAYVLVVAACATTVLRHRALTPRPQNLLFFSSLVVVQVVLFFGQVPGLLWHEAFHTLAGRRLGVPSRLRVSRRLYFIVFETALDGILSFPKRKRYLPFVAGMMADILLFSLLTLGAAAAGGAGASPPFLARLALALAYLTLLRLAWQLYLFLRTDLYYVFSTALGCAGLYDATRAYLANRAWRLLGRPERLVDEAAWSPRDRAVARWYAPVTVLGMVLLAGVAAVGVLPAMAEFAGRLVHALSGGTRGARFWDAATFAVLTLAQGSALFLISFVPWVRRRRQGRPSLTTARPLSPGAQP